MTIGEFASHALSTRLVRQSTLDSYHQTIRLLGITDVPMTEVTVQFLYLKLQGVTNINTRRKYTVALRSIFRDDIPNIKELRIPKAVPRHYDLPSEETLRFILMMSPYEFYGLLMMYAGLRVGEACAITSKDIRGNVLKVHKQRDENGVLVISKTQGEVIIPRWLAERVANHQTETVTPGAVRESLWRYGKKVGVHINPHMFRTWYATVLAKNKVNPKVAQKQLRHADIKTTLDFYTQFSGKDIDEVVEDLFNGEGNN
ncbi:site-specific integrase [Streptomyces sp. NBC_01571]|uniref:tyrosine-type recombinase/integrase n=1 Tax=Streptomyces sp. NBC_01571 TaxID=2975883 RepID=UPI002257451D|nr:tyrosine-type recombinase/integrase [Streptomyces sp. NBC_01571]MCX4577956.1 site-specific integrase [Streptomyces sp. NBC_01571]